MSDIVQLVDDYGNAALRAGKSNSRLVIDPRGPERWQAMQDLRQKLRVEVERLRAVEKAATSFLGMGIHSRKHLCCCLDGYCSACQLRDAVEAAAETKEGG